MILRYRNPRYIDVNVKGLEGCVFLKEPIGMVSRQSDDDHWFGSFATKYLAELLTRTKPEKHAK